MPEAALEVERPGSFEDLRCEQPELSETDLIIEYTSRLARFRREVQGPADPPLRTIADYMPNEFGRD